MSDRAVLAPGDDSFQNDFIRRAGGIPPVWGQKGALVSVSPQDWQRFNPQVVYGCGPGLPTFGPLLRQPGYEGVEAVQRGRLLNFPCALTCRASIHAGDFIAWLAASLFTEEFSDPRQTVLPQQVLGRRPVAIDLPFVRRAELVTSRILDFEHKTLLITLRAPTSVLSTLEGPREGILQVGNHYTPPPGWPLSHHRGLRADRTLVYGVLGCPEKQTSFLFTGADMDHVAIKKEQFQELTVYALATAGVEGNALRLGRDEGRFYEPGTINIIVLSNCRLSPRAMSRALLDITEAKTAALQDLDIRSTEQPAWQATGTGTDNIIVVAGQGRLLELAGGHTKLGELIGKAVYQAVREAVGRQNGITQGRPVWQRWQERRFDLYSLLPPSLSAAQRQRLLAAWDELLTQPQSAGFLEAALALSDAWERGQINDLSAYETWCRQVAEGLAGRPLAPEEWQTLPATLPQPLRLAAEALLSGTGRAMAFLLMPLRKNNRLTSLRNLMSFFCPGGKAA
jgi:iron complex transport system substrate-binding protein